MRPFKSIKNPFLIFVLQLFIAAVCLCPFWATGEEIRFEETYQEQVVEGTLVGNGNSTLNITLLWNGFDPSQFDEGTVIEISINSFQFSETLLAAGNYEEGSTSLTFNVSSAGHLTVSWNNTSFTISGTIQNLNVTPGDAGLNFFGAMEHLGTSKTITDSYPAIISFGGYSTNRSVAVTGRNTVAHQTIDEEEFTKNNVELSGRADFPAPDTTRPTVSIVSPTANGRLFTPHFTGKATDNRGVGQVYYRIGTNDFTLANGTTNWSADLSLLSLPPGTNTMQVKSVDLSGNESLVLTRTFFYVVTNALALEIVENGWGTTTLTNGQFLELTKNYSITAKPAVGYLFREWLGNTTNSANPTLTFTMEPDLFLQALFMPNPFGPIKGVFNGLFSETNGVTPATAGFLTVTLKDSGTFSGKILLEGATHPISGAFNSDGQANKSILRRGKPSLDLQMRFDFEGRRLDGTITQGNTTSVLDAERVQSTTNSAKTKYTLVIPPGVNPATEPGGYGYGCATVDLKGKLQFRGTLGDGTVASQAATVSENGRWPWFVSLYRGKGVLHGWMSFTNEPDSDVHGTNVTWAKFPGAVSKLYKNGFTLAGPVVGSKYVAPLLGSPLVNWTAGLVEFGGGNLAATLTNEVTYATNNKILIDPTNKTVLSIVTASGLLNGKFLNPTTGKSIPVKGALLQKQQMGAGVFLGTNQSGYFLLEADTE